MTWTLKVRSNPGSTITADYECPAHGRFQLTIERDENGDPPEWVHCTWRNTNYEDVLPPPAIHCYLACQHVMSAPGAVGVKQGEMVRGRSGERPSEKHVMDTSLLADGMPLDEWKARRAAVHRDESLRRVRQAFGKTPKVFR